ncbi:uncharacterized protein [Temnothorax longispinosus]|uniref:uncharacterized protein n=1 Tax=Temnothorax longispinosus TaxID=300112 RepID=UPI003A994CE9
MVESIETILKYRKIAGVSFKNPYLFGIPSSSKTRFKYVRACKLMREYSATCGAENVSTLRGTILRKHIATKCLSLNLTETEVSHVANFMGHHQDIHKQIYRQPVAKVDILDMSKILEKAGNVSAHNTTNSSVTRENITDITDTSTTNLTSEIEEMGCISTDSNKNEITQISKEESENEILENEDSEDDISLPFADTSNENILKQKKAKKRKYSGDVLSKSNKHKKKTQFTQPRKKIVRPRWTVEEKKIAFSLFEENINTHILPSLNEITSKIRKTILKDRGSAAVNTWLYTLICKKKAQTKK